MINRCKIVYFFLPTKLEGGLSVEARDVTSERGLHPGSRRLINIRDTGSGTHSTVHRDTRQLRWVSFFSFVLVSFWLSVSFGDESGADWGFKRQMVSGISVWMWTCALHMCVCLYTWIDALLSSADAQALPEFHLFKSVLYVSFKWSSLSGTDTRKALPSYICCLLRPHLPCKYCCCACGRHLNRQTFTFRHLYSFPLEWSEMFRYIVEMFS